MLGSVPLVQCIVPNPLQASLNSKTLELLVRTVCLLRATLAKVGLSPEKNARFSVYADYQHKALLQFSFSKFSQAQTV